MKKLLKFKKSKRLERKYNPIYEDRKKIVDEKLIDLIKLKKENKRNFLNQVAVQASLRYAYSYLKSAVNAEDAYGVHGWIKTYFPEEYTWLINNDIFDIACMYAKQMSGKPEVGMIFRGINISKYIATLLILKKEHNFEFYPDLRYDACYVLTPEPFRSALSWHKENQYELDGFPTKADVGPGNWKKVGEVTWDRPMYLLLHAPGKDIGINEAVAEAKDISAAIVSKQERIIHDLRNKTDLTKKKTSQRETEKAQWEGLATDFEKDRYVLISKDRIARYRQEKKEEEKEIPQSVWTLLGITLLGIFAIIIVFLIMNKLGGI